MMSKKKIMIFGIIVPFIIICIAGCSGEEYMNDQDFQKAYTDPEKYVGKYVKFGGYIDDREKIDSNTDALLVARGKDLDEFKGSYICVKAKDTSKYNIGDYVEFDGKVVGTDDYPGLTIKCNTMKKSSYIKEVHPAKHTKKINITENRNGINYTLEKVEFSEKETRLYVRIENTNTHDAVADTYSASIESDNGDEYSPELPPPDAYKDYMVCEDLRIGPGSSVREIIRIPYRLDHTKTYKLNTNLYAYDTSNLSDGDISIKF